MRRFALHQHTNHRRSLPIALLGVLLMTGVSLAATSTPAGASPGSLSDIDVTAVTMGTNVIAALTVGGTIQVEVVTCTGPACDKHGWTSLGSGFKSVTVQYLTGPRVVVIARRDDGATWYKRGNCSGTACSWESWRNLGGAVINVLASNATGCALLAGQTSTKRVYQAQVCGASDMERCADFPMAPDICGASTGTPTSGPTTAARGANWTTRKLLALDRPGMCGPTARITIVRAGAAK